MSGTTAVYRDPVIHKGDENPHFGGRQVVLCCWEVVNHSRGTQSIKPSDRGSCCEGTGNESSKLPMLLRQEGLGPNCLGRLSVLTDYLHSG